MIKPLTAREKKFEVESLKLLGKQYEKIDTSSIDTEWQRQSDRYHDMLEEIGKLHDKKGRDYGRDEDQYANLRASEQWGIPAWQGALMRQCDKIARIQTFVIKGKLENESLEDSLWDNAVYALNGLALWLEKNKK
jgi:hypothetical protein